MQNKYQHVVLFAISSRKRDSSQLIKREILSMNRVCMLLMLSCLLFVERGSRKMIELINDMWSSIETWITNINLRCRLCDFFCLIDCAEIIGRSRFISFFSSGCLSFVRTLDHILQGNLTLTDMRRLIEPYYRYTAPRNPNWLHVLLNCWIWDLTWNIWACACQTKYSHCTCERWKI
jgi:hypothetical protein